MVTKILICFVSNLLVILYFLIIPYNLSVSSIMLLISCECSYPHMIITDLCVKVISTDGIKSPIPRREHRHIKYPNKRSILGRFHLDWHMYQYSLQGVKESFFVINCTPTE